jgi:hypothetical protein
MGASPEGFSILAHLQSWHFLPFSDKSGIKQGILLLCPIGSFLLLHQTVPDGGLCPSGALSSPYLQQLHVYIANQCLSPLFPLAEGQGQKPALPGKTYALLSLLIVNNSITPI